MIQIGTPFIIWACKAHFIIMMLKELTFITTGLCHLNLWLRSQSHWLFLGVPLVTMAAKYPLLIFKDHLIKVSRLTHSPPMGSSITDNLI